MEINLRPNLSCVPRRVFSCSTRHFCPSISHSRVRQLSHAGHDDT